MGYLSLRRKTSVSQKDPDQLWQQLVDMILYVSKLTQNVDPSSTIAMDETALWYDMTANTTVDVTGAKTISLKTKGIEKTRFTVVLSAKGDGTKLRPYVVFKKGIRETKKLQQGIVVRSNDNGWRNNDLTSD